MAGMQGGGGQVQRGAASKGGLKEGGGITWHKLVGWGLRSRWRGATFCQRDPKAGVERGQRGQGSILKDKSLVSTARMETAAAAL